MTDACLTIPELAERWKCDKRLVGAAIKDGRLKSFRVGTRPEHYIGDLESWHEAEAALFRVLDERGARYAVEAGDGAFYGPKIDILMEDSLGREWQMGTIQLDFQIPRRFGCEYVDANGERKSQARLSLPVKRSRALDRSPGEPCPNRAV